MKPFSTKLNWWHFCDQEFLLCWPCLFCCNKSTLFDKLSSFQKTQFHYQDLHNNHYIWKVWQFWCIVPTWLYMLEQTYNHNVLACFSMLATLSAPSILYGGTTDNFQYQILNRGVQKKMSAWRNLNSSYKRYFLGGGGGGVLTMVLVKNSMKYSVK